MSDVTIQVPIVKAVRLNKDGEPRANLVFGWANVPYPAEGTLAKNVQQGIDEGRSLEEISDDVRAAYNAQFPDDPETGIWNWVVAVFVDHVVAEHRDATGSTFLRRAMVHNEDGTYTFGTGVEVERTFVAKALADYSEALVKARQPKIDLEGDRVRLPALEKAAYSFVLHSGNADIDHNEVVHGGLVESVVITDEKLAAMGVPETARAGISKGWWLGFEVDDPTMDRVEADELTMFSVGGSALRVPAV